LDEDRKSYEPISLEAVEIAADNGSVAIRGQRLLMLTVE
jgi:hypothetical protein